MVSRSRGTGLAAGGGRISSALDRPIRVAFLDMEPTFTEGRFCRSSGQDGL